MNLTQSSPSDAGGGRRMNLTLSGVQAIGNWKSAIGVPLRTALHVSMDICGRTGAEACKHALILMAQSASAITPVARKSRTVRKNPDFEHLVTDAQYKALRAAGRDMKRYYTHTATAYIQPGMHVGRGTPYARYANDPDQLKRIRNRGLARRSWRWSLSQLGSRQSPGRPIPGVNTVHAMRAPWRNGYQMRNKLSYILGIMPAGWQQTVETKAGNKIMAQAAKKLESKWRAAVGAPKSATISRPDLAAMFSTALRAG